MEGDECNIGKAMLKGVLHAWMGEFSAKDTTYSSWGGISLNPRPIE